jgi:hypothetical protein
MPAGPRRPVSHLDHACLTTDKPPAPNSDLDDDQVTGLGPPRTSTTDELCQRHRRGFSPWYLLAPPSSEDEAPRRRDRKPQTRMTGASEQSGCAPDPRRVPPLVLTRQGPKSPVHIVTRAIHCPSKPSFVGSPHLSNDRTASHPGPCCDGGLAARTSRSPPHRRRARARLVRDLITGCGPQLAECSSPGLAGPAS